MAISAETIVEYLVKTKIRRFDYINATGEDPSDGSFPIGGDMYYTAFTNCSGDFNEAAREYDRDMSTLWNNFGTALFNISEAALASYELTRNYFTAAFETDYPSTADEDFAKQREIYNILWQAIIFCWLYELYARIESEKQAEDKKEACKKLLYDVIGKAAISPTLSNELDNNASAGNNISAAAAVEVGDQSSAILTGFLDFFTDLAD